MANVVDAILVDRRHTLGADNMFKSYQKNGLPKMKAGATGDLTFKTAAEYEAERLTCGASEGK